MSRAGSGYFGGLLVAFFCLTANASAGSITASYNYTYTGTTADAGCSAFDGARDNFSGTGGNSIDSPDSVTFSICDGVPGLLAGGEFLINDGADGELEGTFTGSFVGTNSNNGDDFDATYVVTSETGNYLGVPLTGIFEVATGNVSKIDTNPGDYLTGTISIAPEPVTTVLTGSGLLLLGLSRKLLKRRA